jgi:hypothetical protein
VELSQEYPRLDISLAKEFAQEPAGPGGLGLNLMPKKLQEQIAAESFL